ncbi:putative TraH protein, partial [Pseudomonas coronafaciens pv. garcae]
LWAAPAVVLLLSGCQSFCEKPPAAPTPSATAAPVHDRVALQQETLWMEGAINTRSTLPTDSIRAQSDLVAV